jgi:hypothetical protein
MKIPVHEFIMWAPKLPEGQNGEREGRRDEKKYGRKEGKKGRREEKKEGGKEEGKESVTIYIYVPHLLFPHKVFASV